jgi:conjugative relaxase-like TrwC/TraI family protein
VIAKVRVLGLRAADARALRAAGTRILEYLEGGKGDDRGNRAGAGAPTVNGADGIAGGLPGPAVSVDRLARYYEAGPNGRSRGRARGAGAPGLGLVGVVSGEQLVRALAGDHPATGQPLLGARGSSGRAACAPKGSRPAPRHGPPDERLTIPEAAYIAGVDPRHLRRLAEHQPRTRFDTPTPSNELDPRVTRRLVEVLTGRPVNLAVPGADNDFLLADKDPATGEWRVRRAELERYMAERSVPDTVMGYDIVCAAPKSVSLLWAVGDTRIRADIAEAFDAAVDTTIAYLEDHACFGMVDGRNQPGDGLAVASYVHDTSRSDDAHLHTHNLVLNAVRVAVRDGTGRPVTDTEGRPRVEWRALDSGSLLRHVKTAGHVGAAELRHQLATRWGVEWNTARNGVAEIKGFPPGLLHAFSTRHDQVLEEFAQLVEAGFDADAATEVAAQRASRPAKTVLADDAVRAVQLDKLAATGWTPERLLGLLAVAPRAVDSPTDIELAELADQLVGPSGLTERHTTFTTREAHQAVADWAGDRLTGQQVRAVAEAFLADRRVVACGPGERTRVRQDPEQLFTTEDLLAAEDNLFTLYRQGRVDHGATPTGVIAGPAVDVAVATIDARLAAERDDPAARLSDEQAALVREILGCGDLIRCVLGPAGTGKTEAMRAAAKAWQDAGYTVVGSANGGAQTEQVGARLTIDAQVVRSWLTRLETAEDPARVWPANTVVIIDEATQVATRDAEKLARWATHTGTVIVFVGDPAQLGSVGAGGWFRHIVYAEGAPSLSTVYRQAGAEMSEVRAALSGLRSEMPARVRKAMDRLAADGRIRVYDNPEALLAQVVDDWYTDRQQRLTNQGPRPRKASQMMAAHHREVDTLNALARRRLIADGTVTGTELPVGERRFSVGDEVVTLTQAGHTLVPAGAPRDRYIRTGTVGTVTAVHIDPDHADQQHLTVDFPGRGPVRVDWTYLHHQFDDGRTGGLSHAYAITADRSQGSTMHAARAVTTDTTSRAGFYVMVSRGERDLAAYLVTDRDLALHVDDEQWLPVLRHPGGPFQAVVDHLEQSRTERLAADLDPDAGAAHALRRDRSLAELTAIRRAAETMQDPTDVNPRVSFVVARRAEFAEEAAVDARAVSTPRPELVARLGPRPAGGTPRRTWDEAVRAAAAYHARWDPQPGQPGYGRRAAWAIGPRPADERSDWAEQRARAEAIVSRWTASLDPAQRQRFWQPIERIPRDRATAGVHALLAGGVPADHIDAALAARERRSARAGAAVLEHRVNKLLSSHGIDPAGYRLPPPRAQAAEWDHVAALLVTAEADHLSRRPVRTLSEERRELAQLLAGATPPDLVDRLTADVAAAHAAYGQVHANARTARRHVDTEAGRHRPDRVRLGQLRRDLQTWEQRQADHAHALATAADHLRAAKGAADADTPVRERHQVVTLALDLLVDQAAARVTVEPAPYLTDLLGARPADPDQANAWDRRTRQVETWRHHTLGLAYGHPGAPASAAPSERALGPVPDDPALAALRARLLDHCQATLDVGATR